MIKNVRFKIIAGKINKINKISEFYTIFARKNVRLHNKSKDNKIEVMPRPNFWDRGQNFGLEATLASRT